MAQRRFTDPLSMDMTRDLERVDGVMTQILKDRALWSDFLRDPNSIFVRLGLHPPTTPEINERVNRIFYATLTNKKLLKLLKEHYKDFRPSKKKFKKEYIANLKKGVIQHDIELDLEAAHHLLQNPEALRKCLRLTLHDLNSKKILQKGYTRKEVNDYVESVVAAVQARSPISAHPKLEVWDRNYGIGQPMGGLFVEVGPFVTVAAEIEVVAGITVDVLADVNVPTATASDAFVEAGNAAEAGSAAEAIGASLPPFGLLMTAASEGDKESILAIAMLGRLMDFAGELLVHVHNFEGRSQT